MILSRIIMILNKCDDSLMSAVAFAVSTTAVVGVVVRVRRRRKQRMSGVIVVSDELPISKATVLELRNQHFMKSVSISYANTGGLMIMKGRGSYLYDEMEQPYLDTRNNVCHVGHCHPRVVQAVCRQLSQVNTNTRYLHPNVCQLAQRLVAKCPDPLQVVVFVNSGSEANDLALRLARAYTKSNNTIVIDGAYHGHTLTVLEVSPYKYQHSKEFHLTQQGDRFGALSFQTPGSHIWQVPCPDTYRGRHTGSNAGVEYAKYVQEGCDYFQCKGENTGAIILEGGMSVA
jgi:4-aminobutyrate aminotransferase-like enzyme